MAIAEVRKRLSEKDRREQHEIVRGLQYMHPAAALSIVNEKGRNVGDVLDALTPHTRSSNTGVEIEKPTTVAALTESFVDNTPPHPLHPTVRLRDFRPKNTTGAEDLARHYAGRYVDLVAALADPSYQEQRRRTYQEKHTGKTDVEVTKRLQAQEEGILRRLDRRVHSVIQQELGALTTTQEASVIFQRARQTADSAVRGHAELVFPGNENAILDTKVTSEQGPADLLRFYLDPTTDERTRFELKCLFLMTEIAMQQEHHFNELAKRKLEQIEKLLREKLYKNPNGDPIPMTLYGEFDSKTNQLIVGLSGTPSFAKDKPTDDAPDGRHYKKITVPVLELKGGGQILVLPNIKEPGPAARKPLRKVMERVGYPDNDAVDVEKDMQDTHRMKIVVLGTQKDSDLFAERLFDELADQGNRVFFDDFSDKGFVVEENGIPVGTPTGKGEIQYGAKAGIGKSHTKVNYTKIMMEFAGMQNPVKMVVQPFHSFISEQTETGRFDTRKGEMDGTAHTMVAVQRDLPLSGILFPRGIFPGLQRVQSGSKTPHPALAAKVDELLMSRELNVHQ